MYPRVELRIGSMIYPYWDEVRVSKRIDAIANAFTLKIALSKNQSSAGIKEGSKLGLSLDGYQIVSGYIDRRAVHFSKTEHTIEISGRDNTGDLVDCSIIDGPSQFHNQTLSQVASRLLNPFGIPVASATSEIIETFKIDPGESIFDALEKYARMYGYLLRPDGLGNLVIPTIGQAYSSGWLVEGENIISAGAEYDHTERFSDYAVLGQSMLPEDDEDAEVGEDDSGEGSSVSGSAKDKGISRHRPKAIIATNSIDADQAGIQAQWEAIVRAARALSFTIVTQGWKQSEASLWDVNEIIRVESPTLEISAYMLATGVDFSFSREEGSKTSIELTRLDAFRPSPIIDEATLA